MKCRENSYEGNQSFPKVNLRNNEAIGIYTPPRLRSKMDKIRGNNLHINLTISVIID